MAKAGPTPQAAADKERAKYRMGPAGARRRGSSPTQPSAEAQGRCLKGAVFCADAGLRNATAHNAFQRRQSLLGAALPCAGEDDEGDWVGDWGRATSDEIPPLLQFRGSKGKRRKFSGAGRASGHLAPAARPSRAPSSTQARSKAQGVPHGVNGSCTEGWG
ncbi:MAG: hypothetical protein A3F68_10655 [Acidobacteria bacterium RIFCSPLOWO2_12_FULL_54_10]|nr:MAG: hypothetical protein A3F68_10655 [Acidobacteria bacterium RIFCSPLOWO2_12_FULL_54_10]